jgi:TolB-like protein
MQEGSVIREHRKLGPDVWSYRWWESGPNGNRVHRRIVLGTAEQLRDLSSARQLTTGLIREINVTDIRMAGTSITVAELADRPSSYRPSEDSIVRTEARRLRNKLKEYYEYVGGNDLVVIYYRPGSYRPAFQNQPRHRLKLVARTGPSREHLVARNGIRIAVLPFSDSYGSGSSGVYAQSITNELIHELARMDGVRVTAASSVAPLVAKGMDVRSLARKLDVQIVFEGTVRQDNNLLHITSRIVNAADGFQIWSEQVDTEARSTRSFQGLRENCQFARKPHPARARFHSENRASLSQWSVEGFRPIILGTQVAAISMAWVRTSCFMCLGSR